jgi:Cdc37 C terminal domain
MLSLEEGVVDATTEEGRQRLKVMEEENRAKAAAAAKGGEELMETEPDEDEKPGDPE